MEDIDTKGILEFDYINVELFNHSYHYKDKTDPFYKKNLVGRDKKTGSIIWVIGYPEDSVFVAIRKDNNQNLIAYTWDGDNYSVNLKTGKATFLSQMIK